MSNETFEQMATRLADESDMCCEYGYEVPEKRIIDFATRLRAEWLKQCAVGFEEWAGKPTSNREYEIKEFRRSAWEAGAASQQQRIAELESELDRARFAIEEMVGLLDAMPICLNELLSEEAIAALDAMKEQAK